MRFSVYCDAIGRDDVGRRRMNDWTGMAIVLSKKKGWEMKKKGWREYRCQTGVESPLQNRNAPAQVDKVAVQVDKVAAQVLWKGRVCAT